MHACNDSVKVFYGRTDELKKLKKVLGPQMRGTLYHTANLISEEVKREIQAIKSAVNNVEEKILQAVSDNTSVIQELTNDIYYNNHDQEAINAATTGNRTTELMKMLHSMQQELQQLRLKVNQPSPYQHPLQNYQNHHPWEEGQGRGNGGGRGRGGRGNPQGRGLRKRNTKFYCWTHGACAHTSKFCNYPTDGHKIDATFTNKMGGSTRFCTPTEQK